MVATFDGAAFGDGGFSHPRPELLKELARATPEEVARAGGFAKSAMLPPGTKQASPYGAALERNAMSRKTAHQYQALANIAKEEFEAALKAPEKPTRSAILRNAARKASMGNLPQVRDNTLFLWGRLRDFERMGIFGDGDKDLGPMTDGMREDILRLAPLFAQYLNNVENYL